LARCYEPVKKYAEALALIQHASIHLREARSDISLADPESRGTGNMPYFPLSASDLDQLEGDLSSYGLNLKRDWFAYNGGSADPDNKSYKKPLFFNIALNYAQLDMDRLQERAGRKRVESVPAVNPSGDSAPDVPSEKKQMSKAKVEEVRAVTPEPPAPVRGGLSSLLGGWWGRN
jgi:signal recognition particle subunit SRP68